MADDPPVIVPTKTFYTWLIAANDSFAESLVSKLVRRGFTIGPLGRQLITTRDDNPAVIVAMSIYRTPKNDDERTAYNAIGLYGEILDVVKHVKGKYWGIVVSGAADCTWCVGNVSIEAEEKERLERGKLVN